jgi:hypothetical protein
MDFLLTLLPASGGGAVAAAAAAVGGLAAAATLAGKAGVVGMGHKDRSNAPPGDDRLTVSPRNARPAFGRSIVCCFLFIIALFRF